MARSACLCGSTRFLTEFREANLRLTAAGVSVMSVATIDDEAVNMVKESPNLKTVFDLVHLNKILMTDCVVVVGDGYIGESTAREIFWARMQDKPIYAVNDYVGQLISVTPASEKRGDWPDLFRAVLSDAPPLGMPALLAKAVDVLNNARKAL